MPQNDSVSKMLASAKSTLAQADKSFPNRPVAPSVRPSVTPAPKPATGLGAELKAKAGMVAKGKQALMESGTKSLSSPGRAATKVKK